MVPDRRDGRCGRGCRRQHAAGGVPPITDWGEVRTLDADEPPDRIGGDRDRDPPGVGPSSEAATGIVGENRPPSEGIDDGLEQPATVVAITGRASERVAEGDEPPAAVVAVA